MATGVCRPLCLSLRVWAVAVRKECVCARPKGGGVKLGCVVGGDYEEESMKGAWIMQDKNERDVAMRRRRGSWRWPYGSCGRHGRVSGPKARWRDDVQERGSRNKARTAG